MEALKIQMNHRGEGNLQTIRYISTLQLKLIHLLEVMQMAVEDILKIQPLRYWQKKELDMILEDGKVMVIFLLAKK